MSPPPEIPTTLGVAALAARIGIKADTLRLWARQGRIPSRRAGTVFLFDAREITAWLAELPRGAASIPRKKKRQERSA